MVEQTFSLTWEQARDFQILSPNAVTVTQFETGDGPIIALRLTIDWVKMLGEEFDADVSENGSVRQLSPSRFHQVGQKVELADVRLSPTVAGKLAAIMVAHMSHYPKEQQQEINDAFAGRKVK